VQSDLIDRPAVLAEGMEVPVAELRPVAKFDAEFERRLGLADELVFVDAEQRIEGSDGRNRRLPHADGAISGDSTTVILL